MERQKIISDEEERMYLGSPISIPWYLKSDLTPEYLLVIGIGEDRFWLWKDHVVLVVRWAGKRYASW